uniref:Uncharacterized protein n=1 Tax=Schizaphis graminum TaxID=13262 RepID=A0A2S2NTN4_SCHGA
MFGWYPSGLARGCLGSGGVALSTGKPDGSFRVVPLQSTATAERRIRPSTTTTTTIAKAPPPDHRQTPSPSSATVVRSPGTNTRGSGCPSDRERNIFYFFPERKIIIRGGGTYTFSHTHNNIISIR